MASEQLFFDVQQKTDKQHVLDNPDTYIGSVEQIESKMWIMNETGDRIVCQNITYIPGLFKLFDEGIVNCRDHVVRMQGKIAAGVENSLPVSYIDISIQDDGTIVMMNDGNGMDVAKHPDNDIWVPELIFGHLRVSTNYNKDEKKIVGGKNGFGFKLVLIWSSYGTIETVDHIRGLKYIQEFKNNLEEICPPKITRAAKSKPYTKITFKPDYQRLGIDGLSPLMISLLKKRVYDISAVTDKTIKVKYNSSIIPTKNFEQYINLYIGEKSESPRVYEQTDPRWEYAVALAPSNGFVQISFVNGIYTSKGGKHVEYILNQIVRKLIEFIEKKKKVKVLPFAIREQIMLFLRCDIENPAFDSQTKDYMNTPITKFGSRCEVSDKFIEKIAKMGIMDQACAINEVKEGKAAKKTDGSKTKNVRGILKLDDANWAGTNKSKFCTLILCEGDSAKTAVISGLTAEDRNTIGVFPLKGKLLNAKVKKITENEEIIQIKKILGLETGKKYQTIEDVYNNLRYGKLAILTDQDYDGTHIKGLLINLFHTEWLSLLQIEGFICFMNTPILKAFKGNNEIKFYNKLEYDNWKSENNRGWTVKYYKGLGTSTKREFKEYLKERKFISFRHSGPECDDSIDLAFNKSRSNERKTWLENVYDENCFLDTNNQLITYNDFINKDLIHFSKYDCERSLPNLVDGLKTSLRKILFGAFKRKLTSELKVAQLSGYVAENSCYHHGEQSLNEAIIGMAQNFVGSNNINLLVPSGQFGSRILGGKDHSSPRYTYTQLEKITRFIFPELDDKVLKYLDDDGTPVEPEYYIPIIPMVLVNGASGIGTGTSTVVLCYNPSEIIAYLKNKLQGNENNIEFIPYYDGFNGQIVKKSNTKFIFKGIYEKINENTIRVTELPIGMWTYDFMSHLETLSNPSKDKNENIIPAVIKENPHNNSTDITVDVTITFRDNSKIQELESTILENGCNGLEKLLKLYNTQSTENMNLYDRDKKLKAYNSVEEIIDDYYEVRLNCYDERKKYLIQIIEHQLMILNNKVNYINECLNDTIDLRKKTKQQIRDLLNEKGYNVIDNDADFKYLVHMHMDSVSDENVEKLLNERNDKLIQLDNIKNTTLQDMWLQELENLENEYNLYKIERQLRQNGEDKKNDEEDNSKRKKKSVKKSVKKIKEIEDDDDEDEDEEPIKIVVKKITKKSKTNKVEEDEDEDEEPIKVQAVKKSKKKN
jgi:DNA topoisomerase-2